ncbi:type IV secretory system conjugative DNA transfer family protein [Nonomuraea harbinensis]|uniref:Type IV secretory system conjugative DNA transfer family protein n=1 Tax=Nonomuraea harbinensis TaxID=1286938 RepID=A0ABW1BM25_9ACTN|nr:type IV secretion system DNA-binding domain-containing protein [Nonomuraea harbinensis]
MLYDPDAVLDLTLTWLETHAWDLAVLVAAAVIVIELLRLLLVRLRHRALVKGARCVEILAPPEADMPGAEALWANLIGLLRPVWKRVLFGQPHLAFEYVFGAGGVRIRLWVPGNVPQYLVEHAIEAAWPSARTAVLEAAPPIPLAGQATGGQFRIARSERLPLRHDHDHDPLRALLGAGVGMPTWQHAAVQILARPASGRRLSRGAAGISLLRGVLDLLSLSPGNPQSRHSPQDHAVRLEQYAEARAIRDKAMSPRYEVAVRYTVQGDDGKDRAARRARRSAIRGRAHAIASAFALFSGHNRLERHRLPLPARHLASRQLGRGFLLSVPELAALAHLPMDAAVPGLQRAGSNTVAPSPQVAQRGKVLGYADAGHERPVALRVIDSCHHVHVLGPNGTGKSTLLAHMILSDIQAGRGVAIVDAKGDLVADLLGLIPEEAGQRIALIDPDDRHPRPALNVLSGTDRETLVDNIVGIFHKIYADSWGPRSDDILRGCCLTLSRNGGTLADIPTLLTDHVYRRQLVDQLNDSFLLGFWNWYEHLSEQAQAHVTAPIMNKLRAFMLRPFVRDILGSAQSTFDVGDILDGGILLARLPKGVVGDDTARLLGSLLLAQVWQAASHRARLGRTRAPATLYVDETQNFLNLPHALSDMLAEARAYRLSMVLAHQHLAQLPRDLRQAISSDARNKIYFSLSPEDARENEHHFSPYLTKHDLANLGAFQAAARLVVRSAETAPFTLRTRPLPTPDTQLAGRLRAAAAQAHGRTRTRPEALPADDPRQQPRKEES